MRKLRLFELKDGEKLLIDEIKYILGEELDSYLEKFIKDKYPVTSFTSFGIEKTEHQDHIVIFEVKYSFKNSSYFSTRLLRETHTILIKEVNNRNK